MKILYHHRTLGDGAEGIHVREMVKAFRDLGHEVRVAGPAGESNFETSFKSKGLGRVKKAIPPLAYELCEIGYNAYSFWALRSVIRSFRPDLIYDRYITFHVGAILAGRAEGVPVFLEVNAPLARERSSEKDERLHLRKIAFRLERWACSNATRTVVVSTPLREYLESIGVPGGKCCVMPNGVDPRRFLPKPKNRMLLGELGISRDHFVVGFTGILRPWHGIELLLNAIDQMAQKGLRVFLLIVGDGPHRKRLEQMIHQLEIGKLVRITGRVPHDKIPDYVSLFDAAVSPRATFYASPMKVIEYMGMGKAVVVPNTPNFRDIVEEGLNGLVFEDGAAGDLARALETLYASRDFCRALGLQAREKVERRLNWHWNANEVGRLLLAGRAFSGQNG